MSAWVKGRETLDARRDVASHVSRPSTGKEYRASRRAITLVGIKFDPKRRNIDLPKFERLSQSGEMK